MNVSPHPQRPTKYPWPGPASAAIMVLALAVVVAIGFTLVGGARDDGNEEPSPTAMRIAASELI